METGNKTKPLRRLLSLAVLVGVSTMSQAESVMTLNQAITKAVQSSPDVMASWHGLQAAIAEQRVARGGYYPSVDLEGEVGREWSRSNIQETDYYHPDSLRLTVTQMLFDGFQTRHEVSRLGFEKLAAYYDFKASSEDIANQVTAAYLDVMRYRELLDLAKENFIQHRLIYDDIKDRSDSGLGRRVDLDQAEGRLALAESNLLTERTNLHDVTARFYRLVGDVPGGILENPEISGEMIPPERKDALNVAFSSSPLLAASIERIRSVRSELKRKNSAFMPHFDLRFRQSIEHDQNGDFLGFEEREEEKAIELVMRYNLYNGGSDRASKRQSLSRLEQARAIRDKTCREVRQNVSISHNDISALAEQVVYLTKNTQSINKAREAYRKQFDIGQRTLLDLLDTENEYFDVNRSLVNAKADLKQARASTLSSMGVFLNSLSISGYGYQSLESMDLMIDPDDPDTKSACYSEHQMAEAIDKDALVDGIRLMTDERVSFNLDVKFDFDSSAIKSIDASQIQKASDFLNQYSNVKGVVEGHTDSDGSREYNQALSERRANAVRDELITTYNIDGTRLESVGHGEDKPIAGNDTEAGKAQNRRVELVMETIVKSKAKLSDYNSLKPNKKPTEQGDGGTASEGWTY